MTRNDHGHVWGSGLARLIVMTTTLGAAALLVVGCDDDAPAAYVDDSGWTITEAGIKVKHTEAGTIFYTEAGPVHYTEAGPVLVDGATAKDDGATTKTDGATAKTDGATAKTDGGTPWVCTPITCLGKTTQCGDCKDNDGDKLIDSQDPECLGPCDNTEGPALISGVGGVTGSTCHVDCYFDDGNGMGSDTCWWDHQCDPLEPEAPNCTYNSKKVGTHFCPVPQNPSCANYCLPLTPNGCDCFGCCTFPELKGLAAEGKDAFVWIGAKDASKNGTCTFKSITDTTKCPRCTPIPGCYNACGKCELCVGKTTLPPECYSVPPPKTDGGGSSTVDGGGSSTVDAGVPPTAQCPGGEQPCGLPAQDPCLSGHYCISGCCIKIEIL